MEGRPLRRDQFRMFADRNSLLRIEMEQADKGLAQTGEKGQRSAGEEDLFPDVAAAGQRGDHLEGHGMEDRGGDVLPGDPVAQQRLDVRLGEHPAAGGDGIKHPALSRQPVESFRGVRQAEPPSVR